MAVRGDNSLYFSSELNTQGLQQGIGKATGMVQGMAGTISKINPFAVLATGAAAAFSSIAASSFKMMKGFEQNMKEVETISEATQKNFKGISSQVFAISKISPDAPAKLAKAYYQIVSAGYDGARGLELLETASKAATAGVTDTETAADGITTVLNAFKLEASQADEVADGLFQTVRLGKTNFKELSTSLAQVAPLAAASGYSFQEVLAAVSTLTKSGTPTAQAMTQIRSGIEAVTEVMGDSTAETMTLQNAFQAMYDKAGGSQNKLKELTGRVEAMNAVIALTGGNAEVAANDLTALGNSAGAAEKAFKSMASSNQNEWDILGNRISAITEDIGNSLVNMSSGIAKFMNTALEDSESLNEGLTKQRTELFKLEGALANVVEGSEEWKSIRDQILKNYPEFVGGIDAETTSTGELLAVLGKVNDAYVQRFKFAKREKELKAELEKQGNIEMTIEDASVEFRNIIAKLRAENPSIEMDLSLGDAELYEQIKPQVDELDGLFGQQTEGQMVLAGMSARLKELNSIREEGNKQLLEQKDIVKDRAALNQRLTEADLKTEEGRLEVIKKINGAMEHADYSEFLNSGVEGVDKAIEARSKIIDQFRTIDHLDIESLKPYLESEEKEVAAYAKRVYRILNKDIDTVTPVKEDGTFTDLLKKREQEYKDYQAVVNQLGKKTADEQFQTLLEEGENYGAFLQNQLDKTKDFAKQRATALAAEGAGIKLNREDAIPLDSNLQSAGLMAFDIDTTSINAYQRRITELNEEFRAAQTEEDRRAIAAERDKWQEKLNLALNGAQDEENIYSNLRRSLDDLNNQQLRDYIDYWKERLKEAKKGSEEEEDALSNIQSGKNEIADNTTETLQAVSSSLGQASDMFRKFGDETLADTLDKLSGIAMNIGSIVGGIAKGGPMGWLQVASGVIGGISSIIGGSKEDQTSAYERSIERLEGAISKLGKEIQLAFGSEVITKQTEQLKEWETKIEEIKDKMDKVDAERSSTYFFNYATIMAELKEDLLDAQIEAARLKEQLGQNLTGTTKDSITQSIIDGFREGKSSIKDFADTFEDMMTEALLKSFQTQFLEDEMEKFYAEFSKKGKDGLTAEEIAGLQSMYNEIIEGAQTEIDLINDMLEGAGFDRLDAGGAEKRQGMAGAITNITEDTANLLGGYMNAIRLDVRQGLTIHQQSMNHLSEIAVNTRYNRYLEEMNINIRSMDGRMATMEAGIQEFQAKG